MCIDPVTAAIAAFAVMGAQQVGSFMAQGAAADAQTAAYEQNAQSALAANRETQNQIGIRQAQEQGATAQRAHAALLQEAEQRARISVSAAAGGVSGLSVGNLLDDASRRTDYNLTSIYSNGEMTARQLQSQNEAATLTAGNRINSMKPGTDPSPFGLVAGLAGSALRAYSMSGMASTGGGDGAASQMDTVADVRADNLELPSWA